jgi:glycerol-3-phosphate dehydrogenase (NAD(P)+)
MKRVSIIGAGSWGSAFALHLGHTRLQPLLWVREEEVYDDLVHYRENKTFLPGEIMPPSVKYTRDLATAVKDSEFIFVAIPSPYCRAIYQEMAPHLSASQTVISLTKGIEQGTLKRMTEIMQEVFLPNQRPHLAVLSGPSFAVEVARRHPTAVVLAAEDIDQAKTIQHLISSSYFRVYASEDVIGVETAGALKNVIAIAAGISDGLEFGHNSRAALITRGLAEIARLGLKMGAKEKTFAGLAGMGDLVLTCTGALSRNHYVGYEIGKGKQLKEIISEMAMVAEGVTTTVSARELARKWRVEMPICDQVYQVLYEGKPPQEALLELMTRTLKEE